MNTNGWRFGVVAGATLFIAAALHPLVGDWRIGPARPDLLTVAMLTLAVLSNRATGAALGFVAGLILASLVDTTHAEIIVSRVIAGFLAGWAAEWLTRDYWITAVLVVTLGTLAAEAVYLLLHPGELRVWEWMQSTFAKAAYNGVVATPMYALLRRLVPAARI